MPSFYRISDHSILSRGMPWISTIVSGDDEEQPCPQCGARRGGPTRELEVEFMRSKARIWPDAVGSGAYPLLIVSRRVLDSWREEGVGEFPVHRVHMLPPFPGQLADTTPPEYFWLDGSKMRRAKLDFDASGFVGVRFCSKCGQRWDDIPATYDRQHSGVWPYTFVPGTWSGANLFTTDLSPAAFFCTEAVVQCAAKHKFTNFKFRPVEWGVVTAGRPGIKY